MANDKQSIDFDKGIDGTGIIERAQKQGRMRRARPLHPLLELIKQPPELESLRSLYPEARIANVTEFKEPATPKGRLPLPTLGCDRMPPGSDDPGGATPSLCITNKQANQARLAPSNPNFGPITGPYEPLPRDNEEYKQSVILKEKLGTAGEGLIAEVAALPSGKDRSIPGHVRNALLTRWFALDQERTNLIIAARPLDADDEALSRFGFRLNTWLDRIRARKQILDSNVSDYNRICLGRPLPDDEFKQCEDFRSRYKSCAEAHNASLAERNRLTGLWQDNRKCLEARGTDFRTWVLNWINQVIKPWIGDSTQALENACDRLISVTATASPAVITPRRSSTLTAIPKYAETGEKPCPTQFKWNPLTSIWGGLNSQKEQVVQFTSTGQRGSPKFVVIATDEFSSKEAEAGVTVAGGRICPVDRNWDPVEDKTRCEYRCVAPTMPLTLPGNVPCPQMFDDE